MQASPQQQNNAENINENLETGLKLVPQELVSVIPESVWITLTLDQKKEILRQHNLLGKYLSPEKPTVLTEQSIENKAFVPTTPELIVEKEQSIERNPDFEKAISAFVAAKEDGSDTMTKSEPVVSAEELQRIEQEQSSVANTGKYTFFGYQPSQTTFSNAKQISDDSPVSDSKTWAATLIAKIFSLFQ